MVSKRQGLISHITKGMVGIALRRKGDTDAGQGLKIRDEEQIQQLAALSGSILRSLASISFSSMTQHKL